MTPQPDRIRVGAILRGALLSHADLSAAYLTEASLDGADLQGARLYHATLRDSVIVRTRLCHSDLSRAELVGADLTGADLASATIVETYLERAIIDGRQVYGASVWNIRDQPGGARAIPHKTWPLARDILHKTILANQAAFEQKLARINADEEGRVAGPVAAGAAQPRDRRARGRGRCGEDCYRWEHPAGWHEAVTLLAAIGANANSDP
jgi:uncharacterized protein YjbI with pentapeptide repeats